MPPPLTLLAVPNVSNGRDEAVLGAIGRAFTCDTRLRLLDRHVDPDHNRAVFTLAGSPGSIAPGLLAGARATLELIDLRNQRGVHPRVGAIDVVPIVYLADAARGAACAEALLVAGLLGDDLGLPVFIYDGLAGGRTRAELRRGGPVGLAQRLAAGDARPDFGPPRIDPRRGAVLVAARPPLVAFNLELALPATLADAHRVAASIREGGPDGLDGVRAIGVPLTHGGARAQVSTNVEDPLAVPLGAVVAAVRRHADVAAVEIVGLAPASALEAFPPDLLPVGFDPARTILEDVLAPGAPR